MSIKKILLTVIVSMMLITSLLPVLAIDPEPPYDDDEQPRDRNENGHDDDQNGGDRSGNQIRKTPRDRDSQ